MKVKLYLDIDGVILTAKNPKANQFAEEFINFVTHNFDCFWLTTHCKGDIYPTIHYLSSYFNRNVMLTLR